MVATGAWVGLTEGNIRNNHIYLRNLLSHFPSSSIGGSNAATASPDLLTVTFIPGSTVRTDIDGDKLFLRARKQVGEFFALSGAQPGDRVVIERQADKSFNFRLLRVK